MMAAIDFALMAWRVLSRQINRNVDYEVRDVPLGNSSANVRDLCIALGVVEADPDMSQERMVKFIGIVTSGLLLIGKKGYDGDVTTAVEIAEQVLGRIAGTKYESWAPAVAQNALSLYAFITREPHYVYSRDDVNTALHHLQWDVLPDMQAALWEGVGLYMNIPQDVSPEETDARLEAIARVMIRKLYPPTDLKILADRQQLNIKEMTVKLAEAMAESINTVAWKLSDLSGGQNYLDDGTQLYLP